MRFSLQDLLGTTLVIAVGVMIASSSPVEFNEKCLAFGSMLLVLRLLVEVWSLIRPLQTVVGVEPPSRTARWFAATWRMLTAMLIVGYWRTHDWLPDVVREANDGSWDSLSPSTVIDDVFYLALLLSLIRRKPKEPRPASRWQPLFDMGGWLAGAFLCGVLILSNCLFVSAVHSAITEIEASLPHIRSGVLLYSMDVFGRTRMAAEMLSAATRAVAAVAAYLLLLRWLMRNSMRWPTRVMILAGMTAAWCIAIHFVNWLEQTALPTLSPMLSANQQALPLLLPLGYFFVVITAMLGAYRLIVPSTARSACRGVMIRKFWFTGAVAELTVLAGMLWMQFEDYYWTFHYGLLSGARGLQRWLSVFDLFFGPESMYLLLAVTIVVVANVIGGFRRGRMNRQILLAGETVPVESLRVPEISLPRYFIALLGLAAILIPAARVLFWWGFAVFVAPY
jgi:hypothetical protein